LACSICTKLTASRSVSMTASRLAALIGRRFNSTSWPKQQLLRDADVGERHVLQPGLAARASTNSGAR